jgi:hypothetical protein
MQSAKSGVSRVPGLPAKLISAPKASIRSCYVRTVTAAALAAYFFLALKPADLSDIEGTTYPTPFAVDIQI